MDLDVPLNENFQILDDTRLQASVPTIKHLQEKGAKVIICSHLGRPRGVTLKYSLKLLVPRLSELLDVDVKAANKSVGDEVKKLVNNLPQGGVLLLENIRLYKEEEQNDPEFAKKLASLADVFVNDSFGTAHLAHASTEGLAKYLKPSVAGFLLRREGHYLVDVLAFPKRPFAAVVGGCNLSSKIGVIEYLLDKVDILLLGGGLIFTFLMAEGYSIGSSLVERDLVDAAKKVLKKAKEKQVHMLPTDVVISKTPSADANREVVSVSNISEFSMGMDIGTDSIKRFTDVLGSAKTIIWSGPMGVSELDNFAVGTEAIARKLADLTEKGGVSTIVRGGATVAAVKKLGLQMSHMSAGESDASLEFLKGKPLPGILALDSVD